MFINTHFCLVFNLDISSYILDKNF